MDDEWYNFSRYTGGCSGSPVGGPTEEDTHCLEDMGLAGDIEFTTSMTDAWCDTRHLAFEKVREAGDLGSPVALTDDAHGRPFRDIAALVAESLGL